MKAQLAKRVARQAVGQLIGQYMDAGQPWINCIEGRLEGHRRPAGAVGPLDCPDCKIIAAELRRLEARLK